MEYPGLKKFATLLSTFTLNVPPLNFLTPSTLTLNALPLVYHLNRNLLTLKDIYIYGLITKLLYRLRKRSMKIKVSILRVMSRAS